MSWNPPVINICHQNIGLFFPKLNIYKTLILLKCSKISYTVILPLLVYYVFFLSFVSSSQVYLGLWVFSTSVIIQQHVYFFNRSVLVYEQDHCNVSACLRVTMPKTQCPFNHEDNRPFIIPHWLAFAWDNTPVKKNYGGTSYLSHQCYNWHRNTFQSCKSIWS